MSSFKELLTSFCPNARKKNEEKYKKTALMALRFGLQNYFLRERNVDVINDQESAKPNQVLEVANVELRQQGYGKVDHYNPDIKGRLRKNSVVKQPTFSRS